MFKAEEGNLDEIKKILAENRNLDINATNRNGYTALSLATKNGYTMVAQHLIQAKADMNIANHVRRR